MSRKGLTRRTVLRGAGGIAFGLPFLEAMKVEAATVADRCAFFVFTPNGTISSKWFPTGTETNWQLNTSTAPLAPIKNDIIVIKGIEQNTAGPGDAHQRGLIAFLTGEQCLVGTEFGVGESATATVGWGGGISIDQSLAKKVGQTSPVPVLNLGVGCREYRNHARMSYLGPNQPVANEQQPRNVFNRLFSNFNPTSTTAAFDKIRREKRSVIDFVKADLARLNKRISSTDRVRIEEHSDTVRQLELRIDTIGAVSSGATVCAASPAPATDARYNSTAYRDIGGLMVDLAIMGMACNRTRLATMQWSNGVSMQTFPWLSYNGVPITEEHHHMSHGNGTNWIEKLTAIDTWYAQQFTYLITKMKSVSFGTETLLDRSVVLWGNELQEGGGHRLADIPTVIAGKGGGAIRPGRFLSLGSRQNNNLLVSIQNIMGVPDTTFGRASRNSGAINLG